MFLKTTLLLIAAVSATRSHAAEIEILNAELYACDDIRIEFQGFPVTATDKGNWIAVAEEGSPRSVNTFRQKYLPNATSGKTTLSSLGLIPFKIYEIRAFIDWDRTRSYDIAASVTFAVLPKSTCAPALLARVPGNIAQGSALTVNFQNLQLSDSNWLAIAKPDDIAWKFEQSMYLPKRRQGAATIDTSRLPAGIYEVRLFQLWRENKDYFIYDRAIFEVR